jgi:signal transduction histidine kinase
LKQNRFLGFLALKKDVLIVVFFSLAALVMSHVFDLTEQFYQWSRLWEVYQADELMLPMMVLCLGLVWIIWRRNHVLKIESAQNSLLLSENRRLNQRVLESQEKERLFLAQELHDVFAQHVTALRTQVELIDADHLGQQSIQQHTSKMIQTIAELHRLTRSMTKSLRPPIFDFGIVMAVEDLVAEWQQMNPNTVCELSCSEQVYDIEQQKMHAVYRIIQEALSNISRHAHASQAVIDVQFSPQQLQLTITDNGVGIDPLQKHEGLGLIGIRERVFEAKGSVKIQHNQPSGTILLIVIPMQNQGEN